MSNLTVFNNPNVVININVEIEFNNAKQTSNKKQFFTKKQKKKQRQTKNFNILINKLQQFSRENNSQRQNIYSKTQYQKNCIILLLIV